VSKHPELLRFTHAERGGVCRKDVNLFNLKVIDFTIHTGIDGFHFLKAWVVNPQQVLNRSHANQSSKSDKDPIPVILVAESSPGLSSHKPATVGINIRRYLNSLDKHLNKSGGRSFSKETMPVHVLEGNSLSVVQFGLLVIDALT